MNFLKKNFVKKAEFIFCIGYFSEKRNLLIMYNMTKYFGLFKNIRPFYIVSKKV